MRTSIGCRVLNTEIKGVGKKTDKIEAAQRVTDDLDIVLDSSDRWTEPLALSWLMALLVLISYNVTV